jgi:hypothetical protein
MLASQSDRVFGTWLNFCPEQKAQLNGPNRFMSWKFHMSTQFLAHRKTLQTRLVLFWTFGKNTSEPYVSNDLQSSAMLNFRFWAKKRNFNAFYRHLRWLHRSPIGQMSSKVPTRWFVFKCLDWTSKFSSTFYAVIYANFSVQTKLYKQRVASNWSYWHVAVI